MRLPFYVETRFNIVWDYEDGPDKDDFTEKVTKKIIEIAKTEAKREISTPIRDRVTDKILFFVYVNSDNNIYFMIDADEDDEHPWADGFSNEKDFIKCLEEFLYEYVENSFEEEDDYY